EAFVLGSTLMGLAGALYVSFIGFVSPFDFLPIVTFQVWAMLIVGGSGNNRGALLGALVVWAIWAGSGVVVSKLVPPSHAALDAAGVLPLTGSMAPITKTIAQSAELAIERINQGGGVKGCPVQFILRDDQGQPTVGVDAAKYLVEVERVPAFTGTISSGVTGPIISAVTAPSKVVQITCCSTASPFTL